MQTTVVSTSRRQGKASRPAGQASQQATAGHAAAADSSNDVTSVKDVCGAAANAAANGANGTDKNKAGDIAGKENVMRTTQALPTTPIIKGWDPNTGADLDSVLGAMMTSGFQATALGQAIHEVNRKISWRLSDEPVASGTPADQTDPAFRAACKTKIFLGYTSNLISAGTREQIRCLVQHKMVDVIVTTAGGVEEDFIKCMGHTYMGDWTLKGSELRSQALNRIGNMLIPNSNYIAFEDWMMPLLDEMLQEQKDKGTVWTPSKMIARMGAAIDNPDSVYYWAWKNNIPVFCPAITDGSIGDMLYFHRCKTPGLVVDLVGDVAAMDEHAINASPRKTGMIILGGGLPKHHINNANLMRNGADFAVYLNTAQEYDGSDSGARPDEAVSWGKISTEAKPVKVTGDATILFPLLLSQTFCKLRNAKDASLSACQHDVNNTTANGVWSAQQKQMIFG